MSISEELKATLDVAIGKAKDEGHEYLTLEHLLFALCTDPVAARILRACGVNLSKLQRDLEAFFEEHLERHAIKDGEEPNQTLAFWRVIQRAAVQLQGAGKGKLDGGTILVALFQEEESQAVYLLREQGLDRLSVLRFISHGLTRYQQRSGALTSKRSRMAHSENADEDGDEDIENDDPLAAFTINLNEVAKAGGIDPLVGREAELKQTIQALLRRRKNNPILVGDSGVGKTAIVEGLALSIHKRTVPEVLKDAVIYTLDMGAILAGTKYRGEFEQRLKGVIKAISEQPDAILFIDEIHTIVGAGATSGGSMDASNLLKPGLASGSLRCIGSTTFSDYKASFERDHALARRFQKIEIDEPSVGDSIEILRGLRTYYEDFHKATYTDDGLEVAAKLSGKFINDRRLPDKAIDVIDQAGAANRLLPEDERLKTIDTEQIENVVAVMAKIPKKTVSSNDQERLEAMEPELKRVIFGQDAAIEALVGAIKLSRAGLGTPEHPIGSFLFSGPTGVGKTELTKQLANVLGVEFLRFDMSEYMEKHTVSRLIGAPPGYVGFDQGGLLTDGIRRTPYAVLLLDEIEKAHPDVFNILLQVMDHATLTDNNGRKADFRHIILVMTTNAGARQLASKQVGFSRADTGTKERSKEAIERVFSPEFRNRLDGWISFEPLDHQSVLKIVDKLIKELSNQLEPQQVDLTLSEEARDWLAQKGFDRDNGARPMDRLISNELKRPLADRILFGDLAQGGEVQVEVEGDHLVLRQQSKNPKSEGDDGGTNPE